MTEPLQRTLESLRDVEGIVGSFLVNGDGRLLARDLPAYLDSGMLDEVGPRLHRLYEAWQSTGDTLDAATLVFAEHKLHLRELPGGALAVLSGLHVNAPALKMALSLVSRKLSAEIGTLQPMASAPPITVPPPAPASIPVAAPEPASKPATTASTRIYRGHRVPG